MGHRLGSHVVLACLLMAGMAGQSHAQQAVPAPPAGEGSVIQSSKSIWPGVAVTVLACGAGIFAVMKTSARN